MDQRIRKPAAAHEPERVSLGELIHRHVRLAIETAVHEELRTALGARSYERTDGRRGYRNGRKARALTGPSGSVVLTVPRPVVRRVGVDLDDPAPLSAAAARGE